jgi:hypothetical protein
VWNGAWFLLVLSVDNSVENYPVLIFSRLTPGKGILFMVSVGKTEISQHQGKRF